MSKFIGLPAQSVLYLTQGGTPVPAIPYSALTVKTCRSGDEAFLVKTLAAADWVELGGGFYVLNWNATDMSELGLFVFTVSSTFFNNFIYANFDVDPVPLPLMAPPNTCIVTGNIIDIGGNPGRGQNIIFRPIHFPMAENNSLVAADAVQTVPDVLGNFQVMILQGKQVIVEIERTGIRFAITVPVAPSATLLSLLPSIPN